MTCRGRTPHESLPLKRKKFRQFFRVVTSRVSLWYRDHSTANPLGVVPDPAITRTSAANRSIGSTTGCTITEKAPTRAFSWLSLLALSHFRHY